MIQTIMEIHHNPLISSPSRPTMLYSSWQTGLGCDGEVAQKTSAVLDVQLSGESDLLHSLSLSSPPGIEGSDDEALDTGHDEELSRWEQEQIRKGISIPQVGTRTHSRGHSFPSNTILITHSFTKHLFTTRHSFSRYLVMFTHGHTLP